jgi:hypothetical protein
MKKLFLALMLFASAAQAETYRWTDQQGTVHFSESLGSVPPTLRKGAVPLEMETTAAGAAGNAAPSAVPGASAGDPGAISSEVEGLKERMLGDRGIMALIGSMQNDPELRAVLNDPALLRAVQSGDIATLANNPAFLKLLANPRVKEIQKMLQQGGAR